MSHRPRRWPCTPALAALALLTVSGCGRGAYELPHVVESLPVSEAALPASVGAPVDCPEAGGVAPLPTADQVTGVVRCVRTTEQVPGDGEWAVSLLQRVPTDSAGGLLQTLALPSESQFGVACGASLVYPTTIELDTWSGRVTIAPPKDPCLQTRPEVVAAWQASPWVTVATAVIKRVRSEAALAAGCQGSKDMIAIVGHAAKPGMAGPLVDANAAVSICLLRSTGFDGEPTGGRTLTDDEDQRLATLLAAAGPAAPCGATHTSFAVIGKSTPVYVELDGCMRILAPDNTIRQGGAELTALLQAH